MARKGKSRNGVRHLSSARPRSIAIHLLPFALSRRSREHEVAGAETAQMMDARERDRVGGIDRDHHVAAGDRGMKFHRAEAAEEVMSNGNDIVQLRGRSEIGDDV